jgi:hypothetical protein
MAYTKKQKVGIGICSVGAGSCLLLMLAWIINATYWHWVTGSWLDHHITDYETAPIFCFAGIFFFTRVVAAIFDV